MLFQPVWCPAASSTAVLQFEITITLANKCLQCHCNTTCTWPEVSATFFHAKALSLAAINSKRASISVRSRWHVTEYPICSQSNRSVILLYFKTLPIIPKRCTYSARTMLSDTSVFFCSSKLRSCEDTLPSMIGQSLILILHLFLGHCGYKT